MSIYIYICHTEKLFCLRDHYVPKTTLAIAIEEEDQSDTKTEKNSLVFVTLTNSNGPL